MLIIKDLRKEAGMTQRQLADKLGVSVGSVRVYENKMDLVPVGILLKLSDIFQVSLDYLMGKQDQNILTTFRRLSPEGQRLMNAFMRLMR